MDISRGNLNMAMTLYRYTSERIAKRWWSKNIITLIGFELTGVLFSFLSDTFFVFRCTWLVLNNSWYFFVYILFKKDKNKKRWNILKKMNSLKRGEGVPLLNFEVDPGVPLLSFMGVPGPTFKLWGGGGVPGFRFSGAEVSCSQFYTMPLLDIF